MKGQKPDEPASANWIFNPSLKTCCKKRIAPKVACVNLPIVKSVH